MKLLREGDVTEGVEMMAYTFDLEAITDGLIAARRRGGAVRVIVDHRQGMGNSTKGMKGQALRLGAAGVEVRVRAGRDLRTVYTRSRKSMGSGIMHAKFLRVGGSVVVGSTNFTTSSQANVETSVSLLLNELGVQTFRARFVTEWDGSKAYAQALADREAGEEQPTPTGD